MKYINGSTKKGQALIENAERFTGSTLSDIYKSWSGAKEQAYNWCIEQYTNTENANYFRVRNVNTFGFVASWFGTIDNEPILRYETKDNTYIVWLNR